MWSAPVAEHLKTAGAQILLVPHGSPYEIGKAERRQKIAQARVHETGLPLVYVDQVGGQDVNWFSRVHHFPFWMRAENACFRRAHGARMFH